MSTDKNGASVSKEDGKTVVNTKSGRRIVIIGDATGTTVNGRKIGK